MAYKTNYFCWHGLNTTDPKAAAAFYSEVIGWKVETMKMGDSETAMFVAGGVPIAHYGEPPMPNIPSHWTNFLRVDDVDASTKLAVENGGKEIFPPMDIPVGRFSAVASPSGAVVHLFHEADEATAEHHPGGEGCVHWTELHSKDIDADRKWLKSTFGYFESEMPMPGEGKYYLLNATEEGVGNPEMQASGGAMQSPMEQAPSMWLTWFDVKSCDDAVGRVENNGGKILSPAMDMEGIGRMAVCQDPTGGVFGVMQEAEKTA